MRTCIGAVRSRVRARVRLAVAALCLGALGAGGPARAEGPYSFGVVPHFEQRMLFSIWRPILEELSRRTGIELELEATLSVPEFERALEGGRFDFVYTNPYHIFRERRRQGYVPLVRDYVPLRGLVVVAKDSPVRSVQDLAGKTLAVPSPNAIGASLLVRADLLRRGIRVVMVNAKTHSSAFVHVATGLTAAGGGVDKTLREQPAELRDALRIVYETREIPSHPVSAHPRVPLETRRRVQRALLELAATPEGASLLAKVPMSKPVATSISDYELMAELKLEELWETQ